MIELRLTVVAPDGRRRHVQAALDPTSTVAELAGALAAFVGLTGAERDVTDGPDGRDGARRRPAAAYGIGCRRLGGVLPRWLTIATCGLLDGDVVVVDSIAASAAGDGSTTPSEVPAEAGYLVVRSGPDAGRWMPLAAGRTVLGRGTEAAARLTDPTVSRAMAEVHLDGCEVELVALSPANPLTVNGTVIERAAGLLPGAAVGVGSTELTLVAPSAAGPGTIGVHRPPRHLDRFGGIEVNLPSPPGPPGRSRFPFVTVIVAALAGVAVAVLFRSLIYVIFLFLTPLTMVASFVESRWGSRADHRDAMAAWRRRLGDATRQLDIAHERERAARLAEAPSDDALARRAAARSTRIWERSRSDEDSLRVRAGLARQRSRSSVAVERDVEHAELDAVVRRFANIDDVPVVIDLQHDRIVGLAGGGDVEGLARSIVLQLATLLSPADLEVVAFVPEGAVRRWDWMRWLPHGRVPTAPSAGASAPLVSEPATIGRVVKELAGVADESEGPIVVLLVHEGAEISRPALGRLLHDVATSRLRVLWLASDPARLPAACTTVVTTVADTDRSLAISWPASGDRFVVAAQAPDLAHCERWARALAPVRDLSAATDAAAALPRLVALPAVIGGVELLDEANRIGARWTNGQPVEAAIGAGPDATFSIDLRVDGPHALVAGTTGSGKSELLQTWIASLAASLPPSRLQFLLVDYKGGAAFRECSDLPHTAGFITDLTPHLARRALVALNAELRRREAILNDHRAKDLIDLEQRDLAAAPPSLVLVIDEFAALAGEIPEFVDGVIDVAQRGRSLGIHLVLATQRPAGVVTGSIRANTNLRIALRTAPGESEDIIGSADAEHIDTPGRAFVQVGSRKPLAVQVAFAGGSSRADDGPRVRVTAIDGVAASAAAAGGHRSTSARTARAGVEDVSDLQRLVATIGTAWARSGEVTPMSPIPAPLPAMLALAGLAPVAVPEAAPSSRCPSSIEFGCVDEPENQRQYPASIDLEVDGGLLVFGATGSGKTATLRSLVVALAQQAGAEGLAIYAIDGGRGLRPLRALPQVGDVVQLDDGSRVTRLFAMLRAEIDKRAQRLADAGVSSLGELAARDASSTSRTPPRIVVAIDGLTSFISTYGVRAFGYLNEELPRIANEGRAVGVHVLATADRYASLPSEVRSAFRRRLVLRQSSVDDYAMFGLRVGDDEIDLAPGRGFLDGREVQVALVGDAADGAAQHRALDHVAAAVLARFSARATPIPVLADDIALASLPDATRALEPVVGRFDDLALSPLRLDLWDDHVLVTGPRRSGRSNLVTVVANQLHASGERVFVASPCGRGLAGIDRHVPRWTGVAEIAAGLDELERSLDAGGALHGTPVAVLVDDWHELHEEVAPALDERLMALLRSGRDQPVRILVTVENHLARRPFTSVLDALRRGRHGIQLVPSSDDEITFDAAMPPPAGVVAVGRGLFVRPDGTVRVVQIARGSDGAVRHAVGPTTAGDGVSARTIDRTAGHALCGIDEGSEHVAARM